MLYLYNPINNVKTPITYNLLEGITGLTKNNLASVKCKHRKIKIINSYIVDETFSKEILYEFMLKEKPKNEIWKPIDSDYYVSNYGRVKRKYKNREKLLRPFKKHNKWLITKIHGKEIEIHKLVANAFLEIEKGKCIYHKDENICNNHADNLGFATRTELGEMFAYKAHGTPVLKLDKVTGKVLDSYENMAVAGRENYLHRETIRQVIKGIRKTAGGFKWVIDKEFQNVV
ncbi:hypothetical protein FDB23_03295 [Clostridium botulinum]|nr:hypothetical protein [Clostridium botulinum]